MKTREQAKQRALELFPIHEEFDVDRLKELREAYLQCWDEMQVAMDAQQAAAEWEPNKPYKVYAIYYPVVKISADKVGHFYNGSQFIGGTSKYDKYIKL